VVYVWVAEPETENNDDVDGRERHWTVVGMYGRLVGCKENENGR